MLDVRSLPIASIPANIATGSGGTSVAGGPPAVATAAPPPPPTYAVVIADFTAERAAVAVAYQLGAKPPV